MIGCSSQARTRYHRAERGLPGGAPWAKCEMGTDLHHTWADDAEHKLQQANPSLIRCPRCFGKEAE